MGGASSRLSLGSLSIPGTHDTLAVHGGWLAPSAHEAQENHSDVYQNANFDDVLTRRIPIETVTATPEGAQPEQAN
ncbi:hypothetical protein ACFWDI_11355 [Streptomyces sp. NPDC060064]|uniref:hypothetical protein n=1 Tax=Streptomyces sp. NPDC060064 TaxID=3347049 RepID=UPI0036C9C9E6